MSAMEVLENDNHNSGSPCNGRYSDPYDDRYNTHWEAKPIRPYRTKDEYLYAMREDLTEWLNDLYDMSISTESFFESLDNGVLLCQHGNRVSQLAAKFRQLNNDLRDLDDHALDFSSIADIRYREGAQSGTFQARDNISNFIHWCRSCLRINSVLMFETDDLVLRKNDRSFILCLLEVARRGGLVGMPVPLLVQFEREIDRELNGEATPSEPDSLASTDGSGTSSATATDVEPESPSEADSEGRSMDTSPEPPSITRSKSKLSSSSSSSSSSRKSIPKRLPFTPRRRPKKNLNETVQEEEEPEEYVQVRLSEEVLKTLDELVRDLVNLCTCPNQFPMIREGEGKYRIGDSQTLIFVRILRSHVMVRVGGGWDTLEHYLDKHDPCRCQAHKGSSIGRSRSIGRADNLYGERHPLRRASYQGLCAPRQSSKSDSVLANDSDETESVKSLSSSTPEKYRPTTLQLPRSRHGSPRNSLAKMSPTEGSVSSDSQTPSSEASSKFEDAFQRRRRLSGHAPKGTRSAPGSPILGRKSRLAVPRARAPPPASATEEFLKKKRRENQLKADASKSRVRSAPSSPTRTRRRTTELARYDNPPSELLKRVAGSTNGQPKLSRSPPRQSKGGPAASGLSRDRSLSPAGRGRTPARRKSSLGVKDNENVMMYIRRDSTGRHRLDSNSSCESMESGTKEAKKQQPKETAMQLPPKGRSPSQRLISSQKSKRSFSSGRAGYHSRDNSLERNTPSGGNGGSSRGGRNAGVGRSRSLNQRDRPSIAPSGAKSQKRTQANESLQESFFRAPRKPRSRNNSFSSEPGDLGAVRRRGSRSGRSSPTDSVKSNSSSRSLSRLRPVTPVPANMKLEKVVPPIRRDDMDGEAPPSRIPLPVNHKHQIKEQQHEQAKAVLDDMLSWLKTRSYGDHGNGRYDNGLPQTPSGRESLSPTPSVRSDFHHDSGFEDNNQYRLTSPRDSVISPNTP